MKFGKEVHIYIDKALLEWRDKFLYYKPLKKLLMHFSASTTDHRYRWIDVDVVAGVNNSEINVPSLEHYMTSNNCVVDENEKLEGQNSRMKLMQERESY